MKTTYLVTGDAGRSFNNAITVKVTRDESQARQAMQEHAKKSPRIQWHITKITVDENGQLINRERIEHGN